MSNVEYGGSSPGDNPPLASDRIAELLRALARGFGHTLEPPGGTQYGNEEYDEPARMHETPFAPKEHLSNQQALEQRTAIEHQRIAGNIIGYGTFDKVYERIVEYVGGMFPIPAPEQCAIRVYRTVELGIDPEQGLIETETGGGIQLDVVTAENNTEYNFGIRVLVYRLSEEGGVKPVGGRFDNEDEACMVAVQGDEWIKFAQENEILLRPDLTIIGQEELEPTIIECPMA